MEAEPRGTAPLSANLVETSGGALPVPLKPTALRRRRSLGRRILAVAAILAASAAAVGMGRVTFWAAPTVTVTHPTRGPAIEAVYATGVIEAIDYARFGATAAGRVIDVLVDEGYQVRKGDVLARMDERQPLARLDDARARLRMAEADIVRAQAADQPGRPRRAGARAR